MPRTREELKTAITKAINEPRERNSLYRCMKRGRDLRSERLNTLPGGEAFRQQVKAVKTRCGQDQERLLQQFIASAEARGAKVHLAADGAEVARYCIDIAKERSYKQVSKSKSLTTEEIELNELLQAEGLEVVETDLGELIIQLVGDKPFHLVFPSVHKLTDDVAEIFAQATGKDVPADIDVIMKVVREYLRPIFLKTDIGMTGANIGIAETGAIVIETNEGNGRLVSSIGECHICVMGMEKIVETIDDALLMVLAHPVSASGQLPTTYVTFMAGRNPLGHEAPARESHIIILDNGRRAMRQDPMLQEALDCIRCGACMNICPTYGVAGGHLFGHIYPGPIGIPWTASVHGLDIAGSFADLCISCGLCKEICPAEIDMPMMIAEVKQRARGDEKPDVPTRLLMQAEQAARLGSHFAPLANWALKNKLFRKALQRWGGISAAREFPPFAFRTLQQRVARRPRQAAAEHGQRIVYFHDIYANYNAPEVGLKAIALLESLGCEVAIPPQQTGCGYPYIGYGDLDQARDAALHNLAVLAPWVAEGYLVAATEPTAAYCLKTAWPKLLPHHPHAKAVAEATRDFFALALALEQDVAVAPSLAGKRYGVHTSCHQRPHGASEAAIAFLEKRGASVERIENGTCCGMGGTFGMKDGPLGYDLANAVGEPLFAAFRESAIDAIITESSVCRIHLHEGVQRPVYHPLEVLPD